MYCPTGVLPFRDIIFMIFVAVGTVAALLYSPTHCGTALKYNIREFSRESSCSSGSNSHGTRNHQFHLKKAMLIVFEIVWRSII